MLSCVLWDAEDGEGFEGGSGRRALFKCPACGVGGLGAPPWRAGEDIALALTGRAPGWAAQAQAAPRARRSRQQQAANHRPGRFLRQRPEDRQRASQGR